MVKFLMHGCNGKMDGMITEIVKNDGNAVIAAGVDAYTGVPNEYPVFGSIEECDVDVDVVIDFSTHRLWTGFSITAYRRSFRSSCAPQAFRKTS